MRIVAQDGRFILRHRHRLAQAALHAMEVTGQKPLLICRIANGMVITQAYGLNESNDRLGPRIKALAQRVEPGQAIIAIIRGECRSGTVPLYRVQLTDLN